MQTKAQKEENSREESIPPGLAEEVDLGVGAEVNLTSKDRELLVKLSLPTHFRIADLLTGVTSVSIEVSIDTKDAVIAEAF